MRLRNFFKYHLFVLLLYSEYSLDAQTFTTRLYTTADGLSDNYIFSIYQDSYGYLWIGTANGLNRFDGRTFTPFGLSQGLPSVAVDRIYEDRHHRLWIGTRAGMAELKGDSCYAYPVNDKQPISFVSGFFEPDSKTLWATTNKGLYELRKKEWVKIALYPGYENSLIGKILQTKQHRLYISYENRKLIERDVNKKLREVLSVESNRAYYHSMYEVDDKIYIGTYSGLLRWEHNNWVPLFNDTLHKKYIYSCYHDKKNRWWFGTAQDGVFVITPTKDGTYYERIPLSFNLVSNFFEDRDGHVWVAGFQGLLKVSPSNYKTISLPELDKMHFIRNCIAMPSGKIVVSGENGTLVILKAATQPDKRPQVITTMQLGAGDFIDFHTCDDPQKMWFTTRDGRLYRLDGETIKDFSSIVPFRNRLFRDVAYNKKTKQLFVCGDSVLLVGNDKRLDTFFSSNKKQFIPIPSIIHIQQDDGSMLVETVENGSFLITKHNEILSLNKQLNLQRSLVDTQAKMKDALTIWAPHQGQGITKYKWEENNPPEVLETINEKNGLPNHSILSMAVDKQGKLWIATTKEVLMMQKDQQQKWIQQDLEINTSGNMPPFSFTKVSSDENGNVWVTLQNKLLFIDAKNAAITPLHTNTVIEKILLYNQPTNWTLLTTSVESYRNMPVNPVLKYNQNSLSITFTGLQYKDNAQLEYSYRLYPSDTAWSNSSTGNVVSFYQLKPGKYEFEVKSHIKGFDWGKPATFSFVIRQPFWESWWFRLAIVFAAAALIVFIFRYRLKQLREKSEMQKQLHELERKAFKLQMNPHFIHNALNSIQSLVINNRGTEASRYINKFANLLRQVLENSDKNLISLDKELYSLQLYVDLERLRMDMDVTCAVNVEGPVTNSDIYMPPLILQPFVENALWHGLSRKEGDKIISLKISVRKGWIICEITDNGIGRKRAAAFHGTFPEGHLSKAVNIIRQRLNDFNQSPNTEPISFIDLEQNGEPTGTTVIVRIRDFST